MIKEYRQVDENGYVLESYVLDADVEKIPEDYKETWNPLTERFYKPKYDFGLKQWTEGANGEAVLTEKRRVVEAYKNEKDQQLSLICSDTILKGFDYVVEGTSYHFSYDREAQTNFQETYALFQNNALNEVRWTASDGTRKLRLVFTKETFADLYFASVEHKLSCLSHYRDTLKPILDNANTIEAIAAVHWQEVALETVPLQKGNSLTEELNKLSENNARTIMALLEVSKMVIN